MKISELIKELEKYDPDYEVRIIAFKERESVEIDGIAIFPKEKVIELHG